MVFDVLVLQPPRRRVGCGLERRKGLQPLLVRLREWGGTGRRLHTSCGPKGGHRAAARGTRLHVAFVLCLWYVLYQRLVRRYLPVHGPLSLLVLIGLLTSAQP
jgi:hypothetical protein